MSETIKKSENQITRKRRNRPNKGGRPRLQDSTKLTPEMENVAQLVRAGFIAEEIAERLSIRTEKVKIYIEETPIVIARIEKLIGDKYLHWGKLNDQLYEACLEKGRDLVREGKIPWAMLIKLLERHDTAYSMMDKIGGPEPPIQAGINLKQIEEGNIEDNIFGVIEFDKLKEDEDEQE